MIKAHVWKNQDIKLVRVKSYWLWSTYCLSSIDYNRKSLHYQPLQLLLSFTGVTEKWVYVCIVDLSFAQ